MLKRLGLLIFLMVLVTTLTAGCSGNKTAQGLAPGGPPATYTIADATGDWGFPSPYGHYARGPGYIRMSLIFDTLIWKDADGLVPALAESWEYDPDGNTYIFNLHRDITWHDGEKFTARDVVFTLNFVQEHPYALANTSAVAGVEAEDEFTVRVKLNKPFAPFLDQVAGNLPILPEHLWREAGEPEKFTDAKALVGTGPFILIDYNREHGTYLYRANNDYYGGSPLVEQLKFVRVSEEMAMPALLRGEVNAAEVKPETVENIEKAGFTVISGPCYWNAKLMINHKREPFSNPDFRRALAYAINRDQLVSVSARGHAVVASPGMLPPDSDWYNPAAEQYRYDLLKAEELLEGLGYAMREGIFYMDDKPLKLKLLVSQRFVRDGEIITAQLAKAGILVETISLEQKSLDSRVENWEFDLALSGHGGLGGDPVILNRMVIGQSYHSARYETNPELEQLLGEQIQEFDSAARKQLVDRIQEIYAAEVPALSLYYPRWYFGHDGSIDLYYTPGGVGSGVPLPLNKLVFVEQ